MQVNVAIIAKIQIIATLNRLNHLRSPEKRAYMRVNAVLAQFGGFIRFYNIQPGDGMYIAPEDRVAV